MSVAVVGPGSIGAFVAAHLSAIGLEVTACARRPFDRYLVTESSSGEVSIDLPASVAIDPAAVGPHDWVIVAVKTNQMAGAAPWLERLCAPTTTVVVMQNGVESVERVGPYCGDATIVPAVVYIGAELTAPGQLLHTMGELLFLPDDEPGHAFAKLCAPSGIDVRTTPDVLRRSWLKFGQNLVTNGLATLTGQNLGVMRRPEMTNAVTAIIGEWIAVARAEGADISDETVAKLVKAFDKTDPTIRPSTLQDRLAGRPTEYDALHGAVVRLGDRHGIDTPVHDLMYALLAALEPATSPT